jgi:PPOX class probable F420-dependent enzyme
VPNLRRQITMTADEVGAFLEEQRTAAICTMHPSGTIHAVAMWYGFIDGAVAFETKARSQKVQNLRRDRRVTVLVEAGEEYDELRGVELVGRAEIIEDAGRIWDFGVTIFERYTGPYSEEHRPAVEAMIRKRVVIRVDADRVVSWDHRKLAALEAR